MADRWQGGPFVEVRVLGPLEVRADGVPVRLAGRRTPGLLALLAVRPGRVVTTAEVFRQVWPESVTAFPGRVARNTVQARISALRRALGSASVRMTGAGYVLDVSVDSVDAVRFDASIRKGRALRMAGRMDEATAAYEEALALWRGERAYDDLHHVAALAEESRRLSELRLQALQEVFALHVTAGRYDQISDRLVEATRRHPGVEELWALRMIGLNSQGRQAEALAVYAEAREHLMRRFGLDPGPRLRELETQILRQETIPGGGVRFLGPARIARPATSFVGRDGELALVVDLLTTERLLTITGPGGVGKTRLALEAAQTLVDACAPAVAHGVTVVDLAVHRQGDDVARVVMNCLGTATSGSGLDNMIGPGPAAVDRLCDLLADRRMLLILDNCEHLIHEVAVLAEALHTRTDAISVLATSREPLGVPGETVVTVGPLPVARGDAECDAVVRDSPAVRLFLDRALAAHPAPEIDSARLRLIARICERLDGLPLAIELAAARTRPLGIDLVADHLDDRFELFSRGPRTVADRHRTLAAVVGWSYDLLDELDRRVFAALSAFGGSFALDQVLETWARLGGTGREARDSIERLALRSLVQVEAAAGGPRFRLLETMKAYGADRLRESGREAATFAAHAQVYADLVWRHADALKTDQQARAVSVAVKEEANIRAALIRSIEQEDGCLAQAIVGGTGYLVWMRGNCCGPVWDRIVRALALPGADAGLRMRALAWATHLGSVFGHLEQAVSFGREAVRLATANPDHQQGEYGFALLAQAHALHRLGRGPEGDAVLDEAQRVSSAAGDHWSLAGCAMVGGLYALRRGLLDQAELRFVQAAGHYRVCGDRWGQQRAALRQAIVLEARGDYPGAARLLADALELIEDLDLPETASPAKAALARATLLSGDVRAARRIVDTLERQGSAGRFPEVAALLEQCRAMLAEHDGRTAVAIDTHIAAARRLTDVGLATGALESWARVVLLGGPGSGHAAEACRASRELAARIPDPQVQAIAQEIRAMTLPAGGRAADQARDAAADLRRRHGLALPALVDSALPTSEDA